MKVGNLYVVYFKIMTNEKEKALDLLDQELAIANTNLLFLQEIKKAMTEKKEYFKEFSDCLYFCFVAQTIATIIILAKFFDRDTRNYSFDFVIKNFVEKKKRKSFLKNIDDLKNKFNFYEDYRNKIAAHIDRNKSLSSLVIPTMGFLKEENLPMVVKEIENVLGKLRDVLGLKSHWYHKYIGARDNFKYMLNCLEKYKKQQRLEEEREKERIKKY